MLGAKLREYLMGWLAGFATAFDLAGAALQLGVPRRLRIFVGS